MIKFGTSGWRAIIADEFTFDAVRRVAHANEIERYISSLEGKHIAKPAQGQQRESLSVVNDYLNESTEPSLFSMTAPGSCCVRPGPLVCIYAEASNEQELEVLLESGHKYILG